MVGQEMSTETGKAGRATSLFEASKAYAESVFDRDVNLCYTRMNWKTHMVRDSLLYALALLEGEEQEEIERALGITDAVLSTQNLDSASPHFGSYKWNWEDDHTGVLNAAEFIAPPLIHICVTYAAKVPGELRERVLESIGKAQIAIKNRALHLNYTNIALLSIFSLIASGEILNDEELLARGYHRLNEWITQTNTQGAPTEFNSPTYAAVDLFALAWMQRFVQAQEVRLKARIMEERIWMQLAAHYHPPTRQLGGPWSRGYQNDVAGTTGLVKMILYKELGEIRFADLADLRRFDMDHNALWGILAALLEFHLPEYIRCVFEQKTFPYLTRETTDVVANEVHPGDITTYQTAAFSLGSAGYNYHSIEQANNLLLHFQGREHPRVLYARLHLNDGLYGTSVHGLLGSSKTNDNDQGAFRSVQDKGRVLGLYGLRGPALATGIRVDLVVPDFDGSAAIWVGEERIEELPFTTGTDRTVFLREAETAVAIRPLAALCPWPGISTRIEVVNGYLCLSFVYYRGPERACAKGEPNAGFVLEAMETRDEAGFAAFRERVQRWAITDRLAASRVREVVLMADGQAMSIRWDLDSGRILDRWIDDAFFWPPMFASPTAIQDRSGQLRVSDAVLRTTGISAWLSVDANRQEYVAVNPELVASPVVLETPAGALRTRAFGFGKIRWRTQEPIEIGVDTLSPCAPIVFPKPASAYRLWWNGEEATERIQERDGELVVEDCAFPAGRDWRARCRMETHSRG